ncbi:MAG TPA: signal peptidase I [Thermoanaerobaculia bacterium]|nr:signal peptidase I [Thermoanaerobaculia bacterium]
MQHPARLLRDYLDALLVAVLLALFARTFVLQAFRIPSGSMEANLLVGDHLLVNKFVYGPVLFDWERRLLPVRGVGRGDVVVFRYPPDPDRDFIKRCVALPGDRVRLRGKRLFVNGVPQQEEGYVHFADSRVYPDSPFLEEFYRLRDHYGPQNVPPASYFFLGDNRDLSHDSRFWGAVRRELIKGRAFAIYWSNGAPALAPGAADAGWADRVRISLLGLAETTRWSRSFRLVR